MKNSLINYNPIVFFKNKHFTTSVDCSSWLSVYKFIGKSVALNDRTGNIKLPVNTSVPEQFQVPKFTYQALSYRQCSVLRVQELIDIHRSTGKKLMLMYSGGIDSTTILAAFIDTLGVAASSNVLEIMLSQESILENPVMWEKFIRPHFTVHNSKTANLQKLEDEYYYIFGELNDQLFGSDILKQIAAWSGSTKLSEKFNHDSATKFFTEFCGMEKRHSDVWINILTENMNSCPQHDGTFWDVFWWYNFALKWINVHYRYGMFTDSSNLANYHDSYCNFFGTNEFQLWSMNKVEDKHHDDWNSYKWTAKQLIVDITGDSEYLLKTKKASLPNLLSFRNSVDFVFEDYTTHSNIDLIDLYNSHNSFTTYE